MTYKDQKCEVCGGNEYIAGVASSSLGAISFCYCQICLSMGAEPKGLIDGLFDMTFEKNKPKEDFVYFDRDSDSYMNYGLGKVMPITLLDGKTKFNTKGEFIEYHKGKEKRMKGEVKKAKKIINKTITMDLGQIGPSNLLVMGYDKNSRNFKLKHLSTHKEIELSYDVVMDQLEFGGVHGN